MKQGLNRTGANVFNLYSRSHGKIAILLHFATCEPYSARGGGVCVGWGGGGGAESSGATLRLNDLNILQQFGWAYFGAWKLMFPWQ